MALVVFLILINEFKKQSTLDEKVYIVWESSHLINLEFF
jgi:hypothetical protein